MQKRNRQQSEKIPAKEKKTEEVGLTKVDGLPTDWTVAYHDSM